MVSFLEHQFCNARIFLFYISAHLVCLKRPICSSFASLASTFFQGIAPKVPSSASTVIHSVPFLSFTGVLKEEQRSFIVLTFFPLTFAMTMAAWKTFVASARE